MQQKGSREYRLSLSSLREVSYLLYHFLYEEKIKARVSEIGKKTATLKRVSQCSKLGT
jgi:hypothetical protein